MSLATLEKVVARGAVDGVWACAAREVVVAVCACQC